MTVLEQYNSITPADALSELLQGNERFVAGTPIHPHQDAVHRTAVAAEQRPYAVIFGCSDSRLAAEIIFDRGLGDLFMVRTAGHILGAEVMSSLEYGVAVLGAPLVIVLGHDTCGAVQAAYTANGDDRPGGESLKAIYDGVVPSVRLAKTRQIVDVDGITEVHVRRTMDLVASGGAAISEAVAADKCAVIGMTYRLADGKVMVLK